MKKKAILLVVVGLMVLCMSLSTSASKVYIDRINGMDSTLIEEARSQLFSWISTAGHTNTTVKDEAEYLIRFNIVTANGQRDFNWVVILLPLWPFVPVTLPEADVIIAVTILTPDGREVFSNQTGDKASAWLFGDFISIDSLKQKAFQKAFSRIMMSADFQ